MQGDSGGPMVTKEGSYYSIIGTDIISLRIIHSVSLFIQVLSLGAMGVPRLTPPGCIPVSQNN